jgi:hypothetical protein
MIAHSLEKLDNDHSGQDSENQAEQSLLALGGSLESRNGGFKLGDRLIHRLTPFN